MGKPPSVLFFREVLTMTRNSKQSGFSLVELLVVITIIGMIVGLMMVAVNGAREAYRLVQCTNNVSELVKATMLYETNKNRLPGMVTTVPVGGNNIRMTWAVQLMPYFGRKDVWDMYAQASQASNPPRMERLLCVSDSAALQYPGAGLSYVANMYLFRDRTTAGGMNDRSLSSVKVPGQTPLITERMQLPFGVTATTDRWPYAPGPWVPVPTWSNANDYTTNVVGRLGFDWPVSGLLTATPNVASSGHRGVVVMGFCDGVVTKVKTDVDTSLYKSGK